MSTPQQRFNQIHKQTHDRFMDAVRQQHRPVDIGTPGPTPEPKDKRWLIAAAIVVGLIAVTALGLCGIITIIVIQLARLGLPF